MLMFLRFVLDSIRFVRRGRPVLAPETNDEEPGEPRGHSTKVQCSAAFIPVKRGISYWHLPAVLAFPKKANPATRSPLIHLHFHFFFSFLLWHFFLNLLQNPIIMSLSTSTSSISYQTPSLKRSRDALLLSPPPAPRKKFVTIAPNSNVPELEKSNHILLPLLNQCELEMHASQRYFPKMKRSEKRKQILIPSKLTETESILRPALSRLSLRRSVISQAAIRTQ